MQPHAVHRTRFPGQKIALSGGLHDRLVPGGSRIVGRRRSWISCERIFAALMPFGVVADVLAYLLPVEAGKSSETLRGHTPFAVLTAADEGRIHSDGDWPTRPPPA